MQDNMGQYKTRRYNPIAKNDATQYNTIHCNIRQYKNREDKAIQHKTM